MAQPDQNSSDSGGPIELPEIETVLGDPAASHWLKVALKSALTRDPVDAVNEADTLARLLRRWCDSILANSFSQTS